MRRLVSVALAVAGLWSLGAPRLVAQQSVSSYQWTTLAGRPATTAVDGAASVAIFGSPAGMVALPDDSVLVADTAASAIRRVAVDGTVSTFAGQLHTPGWADGLLAEARFDRPRGLARAADGTVFVVDASGVRRITSTGVVTTLARVSSVSPLIAVDPDGAVYVASGTSVTRIASDGAQTTPFGASIGRAVSGLLWHPTFGLMGFGRVTEGTSYSWIFAISAQGTTTLAGALGGAPLTDGVGTAARMNTIDAWALGPTGRVYFEDRNTIRAFDPGGQVTTVAGATASGATDGIGTAARFNAPTGLAARTDGSVLVADTSNRVLRSLSGAGVVSTVVGADVYTAARDGVGAQARFGRAAGIDRLPNGDLLVADLEAHAIRRVTPAGVVTTFAGELNVGGFADGVGTTAKFNFPIDVAVAPDGRVFVADYGNHAIRVIAVNGAVTTLAGPQPGPTFTPGTGSGYADGSGSSARFNLPTAIALAPSGDLYIADYLNTAVRVLRTDGTVATVRRGAPEPSQLADRQYPTGIAWAPEGYLVVTEQELVRRVNLDGTTSVIAGAGQGLYAGLSNVDGTGAAARFKRPAGVSVDPGGAVFVADEITVRQLTLGGVVTTVGGQELVTPGSPVRAVRGDVDGLGRLSSFADAWGMTILPDGRLVIAERGRVRVGTPASGQTPAMAVEPSDVTVAAGTAAAITLQVTSTPSAEYLLERRVQTSLGFPYVIPVQVWEPVLQPGGGYWVTTSSVSTRTTVAGDNGARFRIVASNGYGRVVSRELTLTVTSPPEVSAITGESSLRFGQSATFTTTVSGAPTPTVQWQVSADGISGWTALTDSSSYGGTSSATLSVLAAQMSLDRQYIRVVATNASGTASSRPLRVFVAPAVFTQQPTNAAPSPGGAATFTAVVDGFGGAVSYQWQSVVNSTWTDLADSATVSGSRTASLTITNATTTMRLRVVASANGGSVISTTVTLEPTTVTFTAAPTSLSFVARRTSSGVEVPAAQAVSLSMTATSAVNASWSVTSAPAWVSTTLTTLGSWPTGVLDVRVASGYAFGSATSLSGTVTISGTATTGSGSFPVSASVAVSLNIQPESANALPFGNLDTPATGATGLAGAVAVTGWALDDIGVVRVEIWRDCIEVIDRSRGACRATPNNDADAVYLGDALFVNGARPDVASQFSTYPQAARAGWGLMVLTNMLPHIPNGAPVGGQGTFQLSAYAVDTAGSAALLGRSLVTVDNDNSQLPFGAIDAPASGGVLVSDQIFAGWGIGAGNRCISTFRIYVDGVQINTLKTRPRRSDVDALFPNTCPSEEKGMVFHLTGLTIPNGRHTVSFEATDTLGNVGQFGSRFFDVLAPVTVSGEAADGASAPAPTPVSVGRRAAVRAPVRAQIGGVDAPETEVTRGSDGVYRVALPVGDRLRLNLGGAVTSGAQIIEGRPATLPGGSHLDPTTGLFSWEPPLGYFGEFELEFETDGGPLRVTVSIVPPAA